VRAAEGDILLEAAAWALKKAAVFHEQSQRPSLPLRILESAQQRYDIVEKRVPFLRHESLAAFAIFSLQID